MTAVLALMVASCSSPSPVVPVTDWPLAGGDSVRSMVPERSGTVLLVFEPTDLFTCSTLVPRWLEQRRTHPGRIQIVLTRVPNQSERVSFTTRRIDYDGVLDPEFSSRSVHPPEVYVLNGDSAVYHSSLKRTAFSTPLTDSVLAYPERDPTTV